MKRIPVFLFFLFSCSILSFVDLHAQVLTEGEPSVLKEDKAQSNYVYDLKLLIRKSKENIRNVNDKIKEQAIQKRNQQREQKAREYYEQAQKLTEEGRLDEARELYDRAIKITEHPEMKYYIKESEARAKRQDAALVQQETDLERRQAEEEAVSQEKVESTYQGAVSLYKQQRFKEAKDEFLAVDEMSPGYKAVKSYLQIVEQDIAQSEQQAIKEQRQEIDRQQGELEIARLREKELWRKEIEKKEKERELQLQQQAQVVYDDAIKFYQDRKYAQAKDKFQEVEWVVPDFKSTRSYLKRIESDMEREKSKTVKNQGRELEKQRWDETLSAKKAAEMREKEKLAQAKDQAEFVYQAAVALFDRSEYAQAQEKFEEVENLYPNYRSTRDYLTRIETMTKSEAERKMWAEEMAKRKQEKERTQQQMEAADEKYAQAFELYKMGHLIEAKEKFLEVDQNVPDYKSTRTYLKKIDDDIASLVMAKRKDDDLTTQKKDLERLKELRDKADYVYNEAVVAYDSKEYDKAKAKFQEVEEIFPSYKKTTSYLNRIDEDIKRQQELLARQKLENQAEGVYAQAIALYSSEQFDEAKKKFVEVAALIPDYKQTAFYLERVDDDIIRKKESTLNQVRERQAEILYNQALSLYQGTEYAQAKEKFLELEGVSPSYKDTPRYLSRIDEDILKKEQEQDLRLKAEQAEDLYQQAMTLYKAADYEGAKDKFIRAEVVYPSYKDVSRYLAGIDGDIERKKKDAELKEKAVQAEAVYVQAIDLYKAQEFGEAKKKFVQVQLIYPNYKETAAYLSRADQDMRRLEERIAHEERLTKAEAAYTEALRLYNERRFEDAKVKFLEVASYEAAYKNVKSYLSKIDKDIRDERVRQSQLAKEQEAEPIYAEAVEQYHRKDFVTAKASFLDVAKTVADYKATKSYLAKIDKDIRDQKAEQERQRIQKADALYQESEALVGQGKEVEAYQKLAELETIYPDYKAARKNIEKIKQSFAARGEALPDIRQKSPVESAEPKPESKGMADSDVVALYKDAVSLYKEKKAEQALVKFEEVERVRPNYRSTQKYLATIREEIGPVAPAVVSPAPVTETAVMPQVVQEKKEPAAEVVEKTTEKLPKSSEYAEKTAQAEPVYAQGLQLYRTGKYDEAKAKFEKAQAILPNYKSTVEYLGLIAKAKASGVAAQDPKVLAQQAAAVRNLAARSEGLYKQIKDLASDKNLYPAAKTFSKVDKIIANLEREQERMAREIAAREKAGQKAAAQIARKPDIGANETQETAAITVVKAGDAAAESADLKKKETRKQAEEARERQIQIAKEREELKRKEREERAKVKEEEREMRLKVEVFYQQGVGFFREGKYALAREKFGEALKLVPGYRDVPEYLVRLERAEGEQKIAEEEKADGQEVARLAEKANAINMEALAMSQAKDYVGIQQKFSDLEQLLREIQVIKGRMQARRDKFAADWESRAADVKKKKDEQQKIKDMKAAIEGQDSRQRARKLFHDGEVLYSYGSYPEAKAKFAEAAGLDPNLRAAQTYVQRIDRLLSQRDYEEQRAKIKKENRDLERKKEGLGREAADPVVDIDRAKVVYNEGVSLYKIKRYREARIKFEEASKVGDAAWRAKADRYLALVETAIDNEKVSAEKEKADQQARYLASKQEETKLAWDRNEKKQQEALQRRAAQSGVDEDDIVEKEIEVRTIEQSNSQERKKMAKEQVVAQKTEEKESKEERVKYYKVSRREGMKPGQVDVTVKQELPAQAAAAQPAVAKKETPRAVGAVSAPGPFDPQEAAKFRKMVAQQKESDLRVEKQRLALERQKVSSAVSGTATVTNPVATIDIDERKAVEREKTRLLKSAADQERRILDEQRAEIRKDFENGVERLYNEAVELYNKHSFDEAKPMFIEVKGLIPGYRKTDYYLQQIDRQASAKTVPAVTPVKTAPQPSVDRDTAVSQMLDKLESSAK